MNLFSARILYTNTSVTLDEYFAFKYSPKRKMAANSNGAEQTDNRAIQQQQNPAANFLLSTSRRKSKFGLNVTKTREK